MEIRVFALCVDIVGLWNKDQKMSFHTCVKAGFLWFPLGIDFLLLYVDKW